MIGELNTALHVYEQKWEGLKDGRQDPAFFAGLLPTAVGWKTKDLAEFDSRCTQLRDLSDQIHYGWVNERWLATFHLKDIELAMGITVVKIMQRRPGSTDAIGLDHVDFYLGEGMDAKAVAEADKGLTWTEEKNGEHCRWLSLWFDGTEAKLRSDTVLDVCAAELKDTERQVLA